MTKKNREIRELTTRDITRELQSAASLRGARVSDVWSDWLILAEATLQRIPADAQAVSERGTLAEVPPEIAVELARIQSQYGEGFQHLQRAVAVLIDLASGDDTIAEITDILGPLYMDIGNPNTGLGQFFTPWDMCVLMANITHQDSPQEVLRRMETAINQHPIHKHFIPMREGWITLDIGEYVAQRHLPQVIEHYEPLTIYDPCCGSGGTLLAAAAMFPRWMVAMGLVQFFGQDVSLDCIRMCRINVMLFGLNGWGLRYAIAMQQLQGVAVTKRELLPAVDILPPETMPEDAIEIHCTVDAYGAQQLLFME